MKQICVSRQMQNQLFKDAIQKIGLLLRFSSLLSEIEKQNFQMVMCKNKQNKKALNLQTICKLKKAVPLNKRLRENQQNGQFNSAQQITIEDSVQYQNQAITLFGINIEQKNINKFEEALKYYGLAIEKSPKNSDYYNHKAISLQKMNRFIEALDCYDYAIQQDPQISIYKFNKANALYEMKRFEEALKYYDKAIEINEDDSRYFINKANTLKEMKRYEEALVCFDKAIEKNPEDLDSLCCKANTLFKKKENR